MEDEVGKLPEVQDVSTDLQIKNPRMNVKIDRERAALYGLNAKQIENALYSAYGPELTSNIYTTGEPVRGAERDQAEVSGMDRISVQDLLQGGNGQLVPLDSLAKVTPRRRAAEHHPFRPAALGDDFLQPEAGRRVWARRWIR